MKLFVAIVALALFASAGLAADPPRVKNPPRVKGFRAACPCADACACPAGVCPACPASVATTSAPQFTQVCENGVCRLVSASGVASPQIAPQFAPAPQRQRWYPGKLLGR